MTDRPPALYLLHCGGLYGTERMALATLAGLADTHDPVVVAPPGEVHAEARRLGFGSVVVDSKTALAAALWRTFVAHRRVVLFSTTVKFSWLAAAMRPFTGTRLVHLHVVHGGSPTEAEAYGQKQRLNRLDLRFVAVSAYVRERLIAHGVAAGKIDVVENFLAEEQRAAAPRRVRPLDGGVHDWVLVSRLDTMKRLDLLLDALDRHPDLRGLRFTVLGDGPEREPLARRAAAAGHAVQFLGYVKDVPARIAAAQGLLHTCAVEPFGLVLLEAMAAGVPVLAPDRGGAATLVEDGVTGLRYRADDADALAAGLRRARDLPGEALAAIVSAADAQLRERHSQATCMRRYRALVDEKGRAGRPEAAFAPRPPR